MTKFLLAAMLVGGSLAAGAAGIAKFTDADGKVRVEIGGQLFTEYHYKDVARPYLYPIIGPGGVGLTRNWPMQKTTNETTDHVHHKGLWYAHGNVNGADCWSEQKAFGKTVHKKFLGMTGNSISEACEWVDNAGKPLCSDERTISFHAGDNPRILDFEITLIASHGPVTFGDTKEGSMSIRLPLTMSVKGKGAQGHIVTSAGLRDVAAWGKPAAWVDYAGPVEGKQMGVAIFDSPQNPRHPTTWHVRDYGLFAANPFGLHDFDKTKPKGAGDLKLAAGERVTFKYRFVFHTGDEKEGRVAELYKEYAAGQGAK
jgi:hypothetical protein